MLYDIDIIGTIKYKNIFTTIDLFLYTWQFYHHVHFEQSSDALTPDNGDLECPKSYRKLFRSTLKLFVRNTYNDNLMLKFVSNTFM